MRDYLKLLGKIHESNKLCIFGHMLTFNLEEGFPILNKELVNTDTLIEELLWFIKGNSYLKDEMGFSEKYSSVKPMDIVDLVERKKFISDNISKELGDEIKTKMISDISKVILNSTGPSYPSIWRNVPFSRFLPDMPVFNDDRIATDKLMKICLDYTVLQNSGATKEDGSEITYEEFKHHSSYNKIDQLQNLIYGLINNKFDSTHVITSWIPENIPFNELSPIDNILLGKSGESPRQTMQQYFVNSYKDGKRVLSLKVDFLETNALLDLPYDVAMFALLLNMVAQVVDMVPGDLIMSLGQSYINVDDESIVNIANMSHDYLYKLSLNKDIKDIYSFTKKDIAISK
jgi:thymidylate synthase